MWRIKDWIVNDILKNIQKNIQSQTSKFNRTSTYVEEYIYSDQESTIANKLNH